MSEKLRKKIEGKELKAFAWFSAALLIVSAFFLASPSEILEGMKQIVLSKDALITDYFKLAGHGAAFFNAGLVLIIGILLVQAVKLPFTGITMAALFIDVCYGFWGKNPVNMLPILSGVFLYSRIHKTHMSRYLYTALFGVCLGPIVTEMMYILPFSGFANLAATAAIGILIGLMLPPLSAHTASMHMGYNLFNVGFSAGILAFGIVCVMRSFALEVAPVFIWQEGIHPGITVGVYLYFILAFLYGLWLKKGDIRAFWNITRHPGRAVADFVIMDGPGATLMNMSAVGIIGETYILLIGGDLSGPVQGAVFMAFGFAAFGAHVKNYIPVLLGVFLSTFITQYTPVTAGIQIAALFAVGLAPIAGQFGPFCGIIAGFLHAAIVMYTSQMYGGLNLYNNGFSAGWVAILLVPMIESFMQRFKMRRRKKEVKK
ncbi:MAG: DUF1576 domain-containing protein [Lachnospiraceae bacterium]|nr:DUF1576 domain-containing protein [Lachnospiraceae bacterium]